MSEVKVSDKLRACASGPTKCREVGIEVPDGAKGINDLIKAAFGVETEFGYIALYAIADAIDAEEEEVRRAAHADGYNAAAADSYANQENDESEMRDFCERLNELADARDEVDLFGQAYMPIPVGADGELVRVGDEMTLQQNVFERPSVVQSLTWDGEDWYFKCFDGFFNVAGFSHYHKPTFVKVLEEALNRAAELDQADGYCPSAADITNIVEEYGPLLRKVE